MAKTEKPPKYNGKLQEKGFGESQKTGFTGSGGSTPTHMPTDEQRETFNFVYNVRYRKMKEAEDREKYIRNLDKWEKQWEGFRIEKKESDWQSNHVTPITLSVVETALSELVRQNLRPFFRPRGPADQPLITLWQHIWSYGWEVSNSDLMMYDVYKSLLIDGMATTQEYFKKDEVFRYDRALVNGKQILQKERRTVYNDVYGEIVKPQEFFVDELARSLGGAYAARDCIRRYIFDISTYHDIFDGSPWDQFGNSQYVRPGGDTTWYEFYRPPEGIDTSSQVEVLWYWAERPVDRLVILANQEVIRDGDNPYTHKKLPFAVARDIKRVHHFYAKGEPELLESIQDEANTFRRMMIDRGHLDIDKMFMVSNKLGLDDEDTIARPHGIIPTDDMNSIKPVEYGDVPRSLELSMKNLEDDSTISTGINPRAEALPQSNTATEAAILKESTLRRIETKLWLCRKEFMRRMGELRLANMMQFYKEPELEKIVGDEADQDFREKVDRLKAAGRIKEVDNTKYVMNYRNIPIKGKTIQRNAGGEMKVAPLANKSMYSFFELNNQKDFYPIERGGFEIRFDAGPNIEISKPLQQQKDLELFDRLLQVAQIWPNSYDPVKLGDMVLLDYDKHPDDFKPDTQADPNAENDERFQLQLQLAQMENQQLLNGTMVPATPFASPAHTMVHITFMKSPTFQKLDNKKDKSVIEAFAKHAIGEIMAQEARGQGGVAAPDQGFAPPGGTTAPQFGPSQTTPTSASQGLENRPPDKNGVAQAKMKPMDVIPALNPGGSGGK